MTVIVPKQSTMRSLEQATEAYHQALLKDDQALHYLIKERGITNEALEYFQIGVVRNPFPGHEAYRGRITFPYHTHAGVVTIRFRYLGDPGESSKYLSATGEGARPYNPGALRGSTRVFICEGETDTIAAWQAGLPAVGFPGAESWSSKSGRDYPLGFVFAKMFWNRQVTVLADNDDRGAGKDFAKAIYKFLGGCDIIPMDEGYDVSKFVFERGIEALQKKVGWS